MTSEKPVILVYRRTHTGDPDSNGRFGCNDCMGIVRDWKYDAVIGIGGVKPDYGDEEIREKITWIGIGRDKIGAEPTQEDIKRNNKNIFRGKIYTFEKFKYFTENDPNALVINYPNLHKYMFIDGKIPRAGKNFENTNIYSELLRILELANGATSSPARNRSSSKEFVLNLCSSIEATRKGGCS